MRSGSSNESGQNPERKDKMFRRGLGVILLSAFLSISASSCVSEYNLATQKQETLLYGTDKEVSIGDGISKQIEQKYTVINDIDVNERVQNILNRLVAVSDRTDILYFIKVLDEDDVNAVSLPGGYIYVFRGLIDEVDNDDQLAGVIAHEIGHITAKHGIKRAQASYGALLAQIMAIEVGVGGGAGLAINSLFMEHSQEDEHQADRLGVKYMKKAGYNSDEMVSFLEKLREIREKEPLRQFSYWKTHPNLSKRIGIVRSEIKGEIEFRDYLNIMEQDDGYW